MKGINDPSEVHNMGRKPKFAFLLLREHPYGREMLMQILSEGFVPEIIIEEAVSYTHLTLPTTPYV